MFSYNEGMRKTLALSLLTLAGIVGCLPLQSSKFCRVVGWPAGKTPKAPPGFRVQEFARNLVSPRNLFVASNGDVFVAEANSEASGIGKLGADLSGASQAQRLEPSANRITLLRDANGDGKPEVQTTFLSGLTQPYGMAIAGDQFLVANTDGIFSYPYKLGELAPSGPGKRLAELPAGGYNNHWTRNLLADEARQKLYVSVGSASNIAEHGLEEEQRRANVLEIDLRTGAERVYASGLRNPVGLAWAPGNTRLWTVVNERDGLGDDEAPDYLTSLQDGGFYGWPFSYNGKRMDQRVKPQNQDMADRALTPDLALGAHTASLGLTFYRGDHFPIRYQDGAFIGQHGSWNRSELSGYKVMFVPFAAGRPAGPPENFLTGFIPDFNRNEVYGRPVAVSVGWDGALLVADDGGNRIWRVIRE
ncbi:L-sorbosone dehydrogenase [bacterium SCN 62-11]|nr:MAG: L-sorbosone dehydrogenase [bacterium SCN 62-11]